MFSAGTCDRRRETGPHPAAQGDHASKYGIPPRPSARSLSSCALHRLDRRAGERPERARVQVRVALEHGELRAGFVEVQISTSIGAWSESSMPPRLALLVGPGALRRRLGAPDEDVVDPGARAPRSPSIAAASPTTLKSPPITTVSPSAARARTAASAAADLGSGDAPVAGAARRVQVRHQQPAVRAGRSGRSAAPSPRPAAARDRGRAGRASSLRNARRVEDDRVVRQRHEPGAEQDRVALAGERRAQQARADRRQRPPQSRP